MNMDTIVIELKKAYKTLRNVQKVDKANRIEYLNSLAQKYAQDNNISKEIAIRELMSHEETRKLFRTLRLKMQGARSAQLSEVWVEQSGIKTVISE